MFCYSENLINYTYRRGQKFTHRKINMNVRQIKDPVYFYKKTNWHFLKVDKMTWNLRKNLTKYFWQIVSEFLIILLFKSFWIVSIVSKVWFSEGFSNSESPSIMTDMNCSGTTTPSASYPVGNLPFLGNLVIKSRIYWNFNFKFFGLFLR